MRLRFNVARMLLAAPAGALLLLSACGNSEAQSNIDVADSGPGVVSTVPNFAPISSATPAPSRTAAPAGSSASAAQSVTVVARDNAYDKTTLTIDAGKSTALTLRNTGSAQHNWSLKDFPEAKTKLIGGGQTDTIVFTIDKPGTYDYLCEVHPVEMRGKLTVK